MNDPLTLEIGETRETAFIVNYEAGPVTAAFYAFNGDQDENGDDTIQSFGARLGFAGDNFNAGLDYISNLADSDGLQENDYGYGAGEDSVAGFSAHGAIDLGTILISAEYLTATDELAVDGNNSEPSAAHVEVTLEAGDFTYALAYQETDEALFLELPEERISIGLSTEVLEGIGLGFELNFDDDYSVADGGAGDSTNSAVLQLAAEF